jgi:hypothetical protein
MWLEAARDAAALACAGGLDATALAMAVFRLLDPGFTYIPMEPPVPIDIRARKLADLREEARSLHLRVRGTKAQLAEEIDLCKRAWWRRNPTALANRWCPVSMPVKSNIVVEAWIVRDEEEGIDDFYMAPEYGLHGEDLHGVRYHICADGKKGYSKRDLLLAAFLTHGSDVVYFQLTFQREAWKNLANKGGVTQFFKEHGYAKTLSCLFSFVTPAVLREVDLLVPWWERKSRPNYTGTSPIMIDRLNSAKLTKPWSLGLLSKDLHCDHCPQS